MTSASRINAKFSLRLGPVGVVFGRPFVKRFVLCYRAVVCPLWLSVTLVYCDQTVGWIKMKLDTEVGLDGDPAPPKGAQPPIFGLYICCGQTAGYIKMPLDREVDLGPGNIVLDGEPAPLPKRGTVSPAPLFGPCLLWPNGWIDQDAT